MNLVWKRKTFQIPVGDKGAQMLNSAKSAKLQKEELNDIDSLPTLSFPFMKL